jgi:hypothetical protein
VQGRQIGEHLLKRLGSVAFYRQWRSEWQNVSAIMIMEERKHYISIPNVRISFYSSGPITNR